MLDRGRVMQEEEGICWTGMLNAGKEEDGLDCYLCL